MKNSLFDPEVSRRRLNFNPEGFDLAKALQARKLEEEALELAAKEEANNIAADITGGKNSERISPSLNLELYSNHRKAFADYQPVELIDHTSVEERQIVINTAYKQVFGNAHLMESERLLKVESQLGSGAITVMEFIRQLAKSERYRTLFFDSCTNVRAIELNFKHLLGRAPENSAEISEHIQILAQGGFEAEIDSYLNSDEYFQSFGTNIVPFFRGYNTQTGKDLAGYTHSFELLRGASSSDRSNSINSAPKIQSALLENKPTQIKSLSAVPDVPALISSLQPVEQEESFIDLEIRNIGTKALETSATSTPPPNWFQEFKAREAAATFPAARASQPVKLNTDTTEEETEIVIRAVYKQIFGNAHLMESQRLLSAEFKLKEGQVTIKEFVRELAKSDIYRSIFFESCSNIRAIELNFKHLLGRTPDNAQELAEHSAILLKEGFEAEIDSYLDSEEYAANFGEDTVPYYVAYSSQPGKNAAGYNRIFQLMNGMTSSDRSLGASIVSSQKSQLQQSLLKKASVTTIFKSPELDAAKANGFSSNLAQLTAPKVFSSVFSATERKDIPNFTPIELVNGDSVAQKDLIIEAAYKQVFGNAHLMESERLPQIESQLRSGEITVMEFIRLLAKSERYRTLFFERCPNLRAIELNFKHLLGRSPENSAEVSQHMQILTEQGFEAEIDSYLDSDEYFQSFGTNIVPYDQGYRTQNGKNLSRFISCLQLSYNPSSSDKSTFDPFNPKFSNLIFTEDISSANNQLTNKEDSLGDLTSTSANSNSQAAEITSEPFVDPSDPTEIIRRALGLSKTIDPAVKKKSKLTTPYQSKARVFPVQSWPKTISAKFVQAFADHQPVVKKDVSGQELERIIEAAYKQVFGNVHLMESERLLEAESQFRNGQTVAEFVGKLAKSELYRALFYDNCTNLRTIELNFKHLLGRTPESYAEISEHIGILVKDGFEAEIDSYLFSEEYIRNFGDDTVPYYQGFNTQIGKNVLGYTHSFSILRGASSSDYLNSDNASSKLQRSLINNHPSTIIPL